MWIARLNNGQTITEKQCLFDWLPLENITSLQILLGGHYLTVSRTNDTQRLCMLRGGVKNILTQECNHGVFMLVFGVYNWWGECRGWMANFITGEAKEFFDNVYRMRINFDLLRFEPYLIEGNQQPKLNYYRMDTNAQKDKRE